MVLHPEMRVEDNTFLNRARNMAEEAWGFGAQAVNWMNCKITTMDTDGKFRAQAVKVYEVIQKYSKVLFLAGAIVVAINSPWLFLAGTALGFAASKFAPDIKVPVPPAKEMQEMETKVPSEAPEKTAPLYTSEDLEVSKEEAPAPEVKKQPSSFKQSLLQTDSQLGIAGTAMIIARFVIGLGVLSTIGAGFVVGNTIANATSFKGFIPGTNYKPRMSWGEAARLAAAQRRTELV